MQHHIICGLKRESGLEKFLFCFCGEKDEKKKKLIMNQLTLGLIESNNVQKETESNQWLVKSEPKIAQRRIFSRRL